MGEPVCQMKATADDAPHSKIQNHQDMSFTIIQVLIDVFGLDGFRCVFIVVVLFFCELLSVKKNTCGLTLRLLAP